MKLLVCLCSITCCYAQLENITSSFNFPEETVVPVVLNYSIGNNFVVSSVAFNICLAACSSTGPTPYCYFRSILLILLFFFLKNSINTVKNGVSSPVEKVPFQHHCKV